MFYLTVVKRFGGDARIAIMNGKQKSEIEQTGMDVQYVHERIEREPLPYKRPLCTVGPSPPPFRFQKIPQSHRLWDFPFHSFSASRSCFMRRK